MSIRYVVALLVVAATAFGAYVLLGRSIDGQALNGRVINEAGRQRMLSQRIALLASETGHREAFEKAVRTMRITNQHLLGDLDGPAATLVGSERWAGFAELRADVDRYTVTAAGGASTDELRPLANTLLPRLDAFVALCEKASRRQLDVLQSLETGLLLVTLFILVLEALLIFRPMVAHLSSTFGELERQRERAQAGERVLAEMVDQLGDGLALTDEAGRILHASARMAEWFGPLDGGDPIEALAPGIPSPDAQGSNFDLELGPRCYAGHKVNFVDAKTQAARYLYVMRDETEERNRQRARAYEVEAIARHFEGDRGLYEAFRADVREMVHQLEGAKDGPALRGRLQLLLGAVGGVGFERLGTVCRHVMEDLDAGDSPMGAAEVIANELEAYFVLLDDRLAQNLPG